MLAIYLGIQYPVVDKFLNIERYKVIMRNNRIQDIDILQKKITARRPLSEDAAKQLREYYRIGLTYSSNTLEGNTLTETETKVVLEDGITIGGKTLREHEEAIGHSRAYDKMYDLSSEVRDITEEEIKKLHRLFYVGIDEENAGIYRNTGVVISGTDYTPPKHSEITGQMTQFVHGQKQLRKELHPVEYASRLHGDFVHIHPFVDGNGRVARLLLNIGLLQYGFPITIIPPVLRSEYIDSLKQYNKGIKTPFYDFITVCVYESQKEYVRLLEALV